MTFIPFSIPPTLTPYTIRYLPSSAQSNAAAHHLTPLPTTPLFLLSPLRQIGNVFLMHISLMGTGKSHKERDVGNTVDARAQESASLLKIVS